MKKSKLIKHLKQIATQLKTALSKDPYFIITEADLQGWIYTKIIEIPEFNDHFTDYEGDDIYKIHLEYPRIRVANDEIVKVGVFDISILKQPSKTSPIYEAPIHRLPSYLAFELKAKWEESDKKVMRRIGDDLPAFQKNRNHISSDFGVIFHVNVARKTKGDLVKIQKSLDRHKKKYPHVFFVYIESYPEYDKEKNIPEILYAL